jgi:hypothetical protein
MSLRTWRIRVKDLSECFSTYMPIHRLKWKHVLHPIRSIKRTRAWADYEYCSQGYTDCRLPMEAVCLRESCAECEEYTKEEPYKPRLFYFVMREIPWRLYLVAEALVCFVKGHRVEDCSTAGPDSGNMDHECIRCGKYWRVPLY